MQRGRRSSRQKESSQLFGAPESQGSNGGWHWTTEAEKVEALEELPRGTESQRVPAAWHRAAGKEQTVEKEEQSETQGLEAAAVEASQRGAESQTREEGWHRSTGCGVWGGKTEAGESKRSPTWGMESQAFQEDWHRPARREKRSSASRRKWEQVPMLSTPLPSRLVRRLPHGSTFARHPF